MSESTNATAGNGPNAPVDPSQDAVEQLVAEGGSYELLKKRLQTQGE